MRHDKDQRRRPLHRLSNIRNRHDILGKLNVGKVFLVDVGGIDDVSELLAVILNA
jgi:hypothetical protein